MAAKPSCEWNLQASESRTERQRESGMIVFVWNPKLSRLGLAPSRLYVMC